MSPVTRVASGGWEARWRTPEGASRRKRFRLKAEAEAFLATVDSSKLTGTYVDLRAGRITLAEWWERYDADTPRRATTVARDRVAMARWWLPALGARQVGSLVPSDVRRVLKAMVNKPLAPVTVRTYVGVLSGVMSAAVEAEVIARSPVRGLRLPDVPRRKPRFLTVDELQRLGEAMPVEYRPMVYVAGVLGLRWSEVAGLRVASIDFLRRTVSVVETMAEVDGELMVAPPKSKASHRTVSAPAELLDMMAEHLARTGRKEPDQLVFTSPEGGPLRVGNFRTRVWQPAVTGAGLDGLTFHTLRHASVGFMVADGTHPLVIQRRSGHASISTTMDIYGSVLPEVDEAVASNLGRLVRPGFDTSRVKSVSHPAPGAPAR